MLVRSISTDSLSTSYKLPTRCHVRTAGFNSGSREHPHHSSPLYLPFIEIHTRRTRTCCLKDMGRPDEFKGSKRTKQDGIGLEETSSVVKYQIERRGTLFMILTMRFSKYSLLNFLKFKTTAIIIYFVIQLTGYYVRLET